MFRSRACDPTNELPLLISNESPSTQLLLTLTRPSKETKSALRQISTYSPLSESLTLYLIDRYIKLCSKGIFIAFLDDGGSSGEHESSRDYGLENTWLNIAHAPKIVHTLKIIAPWSFTPPDKGPICPMLPVEVVELRLR